MVAEGGVLDVLCLNAGRGGAKGDPRDETDGMESIMLTNVRPSERRSSLSIVLDSPLPSVQMGRD